MARGSITFKVKNLYLLSDGKTIRKIAAPILLNTLNALKETLERATPVGGTANLRGGWVIRGDAEETLRLVNTKQYGKPVNFGYGVSKVWQIGPGNLGRDNVYAIPVREPLLLWVRNKIGGSEQEVRGIAFGISKKRAQEGKYEGQHFVEKVLESFWPDKRKTTEKVITTAIQEFLQK